MVRKATIDDINDIEKLLRIYSGEGVLLPLTLNDIANRINNFAIAEVKNEVVGCCAIRNFGDSLFEIRSLAVLPSATGQQIGSKLVNFLLSNTDIPSGSRVFALTYKQSFFERLGFNLVEKEMFPEKIWHDCENCPKKEHCDEIAVLKNII